MDFQEQQQFQPDQQTPEQEVFQRRHYVAITVLFVLLASLLTFLITYIVLTSFHQKDKEIVKEQVIVQMNQQLEGYEEFKTVLELYNTMQYFSAENIPQKLCTCTQLSKFLLLVLTSRLRAEQTKKQFGDILNFMHFSAVHK